MRQSSKPQQTDKKPTVWNAAVLTLQIVATFTLVSFFWALWTIPGFVYFLTGLNLASETTGILWLVTLLAGIVLAGVAIQFAGYYLRRMISVLRTFSFARSVAVQAAVMFAIIVAGFPRAGSIFGTGTEQTLATLRLDSKTPVEASMVVQGYYEEIAETSLHAHPLIMLPWNDPGPESRTHYSDITRPANDFLERELIPGWSGEIGGSYLTVNSLGMRDREGISRQKPANTYRIALVGSSIVMGYGVNDDQVFARLLENQLNAGRAENQPRFEVLNFGTGRSFAIHRRVLIERKILSFEPDAVFYFAHQDEFLGPPKHLAKLFAGKNIIPYPYLTNILHQAGITSETSPGAAEMRLQPFARDIVKGVYKDIVGDCRKRGIVPVWIYLPMPGVVEVTVKSSELVTLAKEAGFTIVDLSKWADGHAPEEVILGVREYHANALGHRIIADQLFGVLRDRDDLPLLGAFGN